MRDIDLSVVVREGNSGGLRVFPISRLDPVLVDGTTVALPFVELIIPTPSGTYSWRPFVMDLMTSGGRRASVCVVAWKNELLRDRNRGLRLSIWLSKHLTWDPGHFVSDTRELDRVRKDLHGVLVSSTGREGVVNPQV